MAKPVKDEIFGSRKSFLKPILDIKVFENIFFATCLHRFNADPASRYLLLKECLTESDFRDRSISAITPFFNENIRFGGIWFTEGKIHIQSLRKPVVKEFASAEAAAGYLLRIVQCGKGHLTPSSAKLLPGKEVTPLSRFLRRNLYGRVSSTDVDFVILNQSKNQLLLVEEKHYIAKDGGSLGHGQYVSFRELIKDAFALEARENIKFQLIFISDKNPRESFLYDFMRELNRPQRKPSYYDEIRKEKRVVFPFNELEKVATHDILGKLLMLNERLSNA